MIAVVQRVTKASVEVSEVGVVGEINHGLCVLACIVEGDTERDLSWMATKIARLRIFPNDEGRFDLNSEEVEGEVLVVSQFTLAGDCNKGNRPSFIRAARPERAEPMLLDFVEKLQRDHLVRVQTGRFGASMKVRLENDGPVTVLLDSSDDGR